MKRERKELLLSIWYIIRLAGWYSIRLVITVISYNAEKMADEYIELYKTLLYHKSTY